jgi:SET domain-containing protein
VFIDTDVPSTLRISESAIHGKGLFATVPISKDNVICKIKINGNTTTLEQAINHSIVPNCKAVIDNTDVYLVVLENIDGCIGGSKGTELTINYRDIPYFK